MEKFKQFLGLKKGKGQSEPEKQRDRWSSNTTYVYASVGSAIGLGNFWKFPFLCYKWGGALFLVPYGLCLIFLGIPMLMLEFSLGQNI